MTAVAPERLEQFRPISLAALNREALLLDRMETKYLVSATAFAGALPELSRRFRLLQIDSRIIFTYDTTYFDTPCLAAYRHHAQDRRRRFKVRSRSYVDTGDCYMEVKLKGTRGRTIKERLPYAADDHGGLTAAGQGFVDEVFRRHYGSPLDDALRPALGMRYRRLTLVGNDSAERATVDFDLRFRSADGAWQRAPSDFVIIEVKSPRGRGVADGVLRGHGQRSAPCSKYCVGLNLVRPGLPNNAFRRTLRRHFAWTPETAQGALSAPFPHLTLNSAAVASRPDAQVAQR